VIKISRERPPAQFTFAPFAPRIKHRSGYGQLACFFLERLSPAKLARHSRRVYCYGATTQTVSTPKSQLYLYDE
jgi:hypothetical protein